MTLATHSGSRMDGRWSTPGIRISSHAGSRSAAASAHAMSGGRSRDSPIKRSGSDSEPFWRNFLRRPVAVGPPELCHSRSVG